ncbi:hypothetical protein WS61_05875 [Burkholderia sp. ABCPW 11]|nr:hypothetical protein WS61_05875 [Burkholderia sp. ABCPW 11]
MLLRFEDFGVPMKCVFRLEDRLREDPMQVQLAQALTPNAAKPRMGLRGTYGLFGSTEWWASIQEVRMPLLYQIDVIRRAFVAGQDENVPNNTIEIQLDDGALCTSGIYVNNKIDVELFQPGRRVGIVYALDELKQQPAPDGSLNQSKIALEMVVEVE